MTTLFDLSVSTLNFSIENNNNGDIVLVCDPLPKDHRLKIKKLQNVEDIIRNTGVLMANKWFRITDVTVGASTILDNDDNFQVYTRGIKITLKKKKGLIEPLVIKDFLKEKRETNPNIHKDFIETQNGSIYDLYNYAEQQGYFYDKTLRHVHLNRIRISVWI